MQLISILYRLVQVLAFPLIVLYFVGRGIRDKRYFRQLRQRFGFLPAAFRQSAGGAIWIHAVSVGEVLSSLELLRRLRDRMPPVPLFVSCTTVAGRAVAEAKLAGVADGVFYSPVDYCFAVRRALRALRPRVVVVLETELWPNLYREARRAGCGLVIVNGRISDRAWPRYSALRWFFRPMLELPGAILVQNDISRRRYLELGAPERAVRIGGNLKYDFDPERARVPGAIQDVFDRLRPEEVWIAASTMPPAEAGDPDEDDVVAAAFQALAADHPRLLLVLVPRRPERFETAAGVLARAGIPFIRRSALGAGGVLPALPCVLLLDSVGELAGLFRFAGVVFMGGTLPRRGGHNILEPAFFGCPVIVGPHMENFTDIARKFSQEGALAAIGGADELAPAVDELLRNAERRAELGRRARELAAMERSATDRAIREIEAQFAAAVPHLRRALPAHLLLWPLSRLWLLGVWWKRRRSLARQARLQTPVVSIGGLTAGGTGKSPIVLWLAERLKADGYRPAILTRGYRRKTLKPWTIVAPGESAPVALTGDEAQVYVRSGAGPVGIGADRQAVGRRIEERFQPGVFLLDDGFQHWKLARTLDVVLIDALDPFGGDGPLPLGRLRERPDALRRAGLIVITRTTPGSGDDGLIARIREYNPHAPLFRSRVAPEAWIDAATGELWEPRGLPFSGTAAFCGLGNPGSFWQSLAALGQRPAFRRAFPDHHAYSPEELRRLSGEARRAGAEALLTTGKDVMNLAEGWQECIAPLRLCWLKIGVEIDGADDFLRAVEGKL